MPLSIKDLHEFGSRLAVAVAQERPKANCGMTVTNGTIPHPAVGTGSRSHSGVSVSSQANVPLFFLAVWTRPSTAWSSTAAGPKSAPTARSRRSTRSGCWGFWRRWRGRSLGRPLTRPAGVEDKEMRIGRRHVNRRQHPSCPPNAPRTPTCHLAYHEPSSSVPERLALELKASRC